MLKNRKYKILKRLIHIVNLCIVSITICAQEQDNDSIRDWQYPKSRQIEDTETYFGIQIDNRYKWLENNETEETKNWISNQINFTKLYFENIKKLRNKVHNRLDYYASINYYRFYKQGIYYFNYEVESDDETASLYIRKTIGPNKTKLVDPANISIIDNIKITEFSVSKNSKYLAYAYSRNGKELKEIQIVSLPDGKKTKDHISNYSYPDISWQDNGIAWKGDGFFYCRYGKPGEEVSLSNHNYQLYVYYHRLGSLEKSDSLVFKRSNRPNYYFNILTTSDERFFILIENDYKNKKLHVYYDDFNDKTESLQPLIRNLESSIKFIDNIDGKLIVLTDYKTNNNWLAEIDPLSPMEWKVFINDFSNALLLEAQLVGDKILCIYQTGAEQILMIFDFYGNLINKSSLGVGTNAGGLMGDKYDNEVLLFFESYTKPPIYTVFDLTKNKFSYKINIDLFNKFDPDEFNIEKHTYKSKDSAEILITIVTHKKKFNPDKNNVTLLTAYGGFGKIIPPVFNPGIVFLLKNGGVFAFAHIRGGGDLGSDWHKQGSGLNKQNSINDFIAAAEYLIENNYTSSEKLAITGTSHGGFIVGAAITKRPELFKVAIPIVGVFDLISTKNHPNEFGSLQVSDEFKYRLGISPLHNIKDNVQYPAVMIMAVINDDRVPPFNSYKFVAALQNSSSNINPTILRIEKKAGHFGSSNWLGKLDELTDIYTFIFYNMGINPR